MKLAIGKENVLRKRKMRQKLRVPYKPKPYGAFSGLSDALPEFYGQAALSMGNPAIQEMYQGITDIFEWSNKIGQG